MNDRHRSSRDSVLSVVAMVGYGLLVYLTLPLHEPWFDEAQGWLLARDSGLIDLITHHLRYEGSPGLWHILLWPLAHLGLPYWSMQVLGAVAAAVGAWLLIRYSPFPLWARLLLPFSFYLAYQYAVVARSYCLLPPILFGIAILHRRRMEKPVPYFILLALLANVSAHGLLMAMGLAALHLWETFRTWKRKEDMRLRQVVPVYVAFALLLLLMAGMLWPPADLKVFAGDRTRDWIKAVTYPLTDFPVLSVLLYAGSIWLFIKRNTLPVFIVTWGPVAVLFIWVFRYTHDGLLFLPWLFCLWISLDRENGEERLLGPVTVRQWVAGLLGVVLVFHLPWSAMTFYRDWTHNYSASREAASYLKASHASDKRVWAWGFPVMSILPYFHDNIFENYNGGAKPVFWQWRTGNPWNRQVGTRKTDYSRELAAIHRARPDMVVIAIKNKAQATFALTLDQTPDYRMTTYLKGRLWYKTVPNPEIEDYCIFQRVP